MREHTGKTEYILLGLLANCPQTGYTIKKSIEDEYNHFWQESYGQIYPTLKVLVKNGLVEIAESYGSSNGRGQKYYNITEAGKTVLKEWLAETPDVERLRYEILLKVSFGSSTNPEVILGHLDEFIKRNSKLLYEMNGVLEMFENLRKQGKDDIYSELPALCGKYVYSSMINWAQEAQIIISDRKVGRNETKNS